MEVNFKTEPLEENKLRLPQLSTVIKLGIVAGIILILGGGLIFLFTRSRFSESKVGLDISGSEETTTGDIITYKVSYKNENKIALSNVRLTFIYPEDSLPLRDGVRVQNTQEFINIGAVDAQSSGEHNFEAVIIGHQGNTKVARAKLDFIPDELTTELQVSAETGTTISTAPVALNVVAPPTIIRGQALSYIIDYRNQTDQEIRNMRVLVKLPDGFKTEETKRTWEVPTLEISGGGRITIDGVIEGREKEIKTISVSLQREISTETSRFPIEFERAEASSVVSTPLLNVSVSLGNSFDYVAHVGEELSYSITLKNNTNTDLASLVLTAKLEGSMYDFSTVRSNSSFDSRTSSFLWNSAVVPQLGLLKANQSITVPFSVRLKESFPGRISASDSFIKAQARAETFNVPDVFPVESLSASGELITKITTSPSLNQQLLVQDQVFGTTSPYPPRVNQESVFTVKWSVLNPSNEITPAKVTAVLMPGVTWKNNFRLAGTQTQVSYDSRTSVITWNLGTVPPGVGGAFPAYGAYFQVAITPSINQINQSPTLIKEVRFEGADTLTGENIYLTAPQLTTSSNMLGNGNVQP